MPGSAAASCRAGVSFLVVGTPRSGTTLVQRLACELPGVAMPPETHFFSLFGTDLSRRRTFPLRGADLRAELERFASLEKSRELNLDVDAIAGDLSGNCSGPLEMFDAIVRHLAGDGHVYGEKSTEHLLWWRPLARVVPGLKFITVVRDPRATVASILAAWPSPSRWGLNPHVLRAERWASDQREVLAMRRALHPRRHLLLRYEDVVGDADAARRRLAAFLGLRSPPEPSEEGRRDLSKIVLPREIWKHRTFEPVTGSRVNAWRDMLTEDEAATVAAICRREMRPLGYDEMHPGRLHETARVLSLHPRTQWRRMRFRASHRMRLWTIDKTSFSSAESERSGAGV